MIQGTMPGFPLCDRPPRLLDVARARQALAIRDIAATRALERAAANQLPPHALMERAGLAVARLACAVAPGARRVAVAVGPGNNGGDGLVAARLLHAAGLQVDAVLCRDPADMPSDARRAYDLALAAGTTMRRLREGEPAGPWVTRPPDLLVDAMLGIGAARAPEGNLADLWQCVLNCPAPRLAVDLPSGLNADARTSPHGDSRFRVPAATHTLALLSLKPGYFTGVGRDLIGTLWLDRLVAQPTEDGATARLWPPADRPVRTRTHASHKGTHGTVIAVGADDGMLGALVLAATSALRVGAGRVHAVALSGDAISLQGALAAAPEVMWRAQSWLEHEAMLQDAVVVAGCGGGGAIAATLPRLLARANRLVLDADALNALANDGALQTLLRHRAARGIATVITPHPLEAARLLGLPDARAVEGDRIGFAEQLALRFQVVAVLKGSGTIVAAPGATPWVHATGNGLLATAGTGDVLAGTIGGLWAACGDGDNNGNADIDAMHVASHAVWRHGKAADQAAASGRLTIAAGDLPRLMSAAALDQN